MRSQDPETVARLVRVWLSDEKQMKSGDAKMAATLFVLMGEEAAADVLKHLNESEIETISQEISNVGPLAGRRGGKIG